MTQRLARHFGSESWESYSVTVEQVEDAFDDKSQAALLSCSYEGRAIDYRVAPFDWLPK
jgi:hypothetical protein